MGRPLSGSSDLDLVTGQRRFARPTRLGLGPRRLAARGRSANIAAVARRGRMRSFVSALIAAATVLLASSSRAQGASQALQSDSDWSQPEAIAIGLGADSTLRWPSLVRYGAAWLLLANVFPARSEPMVGRDAFLLSSVPGVRFPPPPSSTTLAFPKGAVDAGGDVHVVWGEFAPGVLRWTGSVQSLWYARFDGQRWSAPTRILVAARIDWSGLDGAVAIDGSNAVHIVVPAVDSAGRLRTWYIRKSGDRWSRVSESPSAYATVAAWGIGSLAIVNSVAVADSKGETFPPGLAIRFSNDGGLSWSRVRRVGGSLGRNAIAPLVRYSAGLVHVFWLGRGLHGRPARLHHSAFREATRSWLVDSGVPIRGDALGYAAVADTCGGATAVVASVVPAADRAKVILSESRWTGNHVISQPLFNDYSSAIEPSLGTRDDTLRLVFTAVDQDTARVLTATRPSCASPPSWRFRRP